MNGRTLWTAPHFRTYFLYMIRYNISQPPRPSCPKSARSQLPQQPRIDAPVWGSGVGVLIETKTFLDLIRERSTIATITGRQEKWISHMLRGDFCLRTITVASLGLVSPGAVIAATQNFV